MVRQIGEPVHAALIRQHPHRLFRPGRYPAGLFGIAPRRYAAYVRQKPEAAAEQEI